MDFIPVIPQDLRTSASPTFANLTCTGDIVCDQIGVGASVSSISGIYCEFDGDGTNMIGVYGGAKKTADTSGTILLMGLNFAASIEPTSMTANRIISNAYGTFSQVNLTSPNTAFTLTCNNAHVFKTGVNLIAGGSGIVRISGIGAAGLYHFYADNPILTPGAGTTTINAQYGFYCPLFTEATTNWGLAINTQSYINANLSIGKNTAPSCALDVVGAGLFSTTLGVTGLSTLTGGISLPAGANIALATSTGTKIGTATNQLLGFYNATPVNQPDTVSDSTTQDLTGSDTIDQTKLESDLSGIVTTINTIIDRLQELGLIA